MRMLCSRVVKNQGVLREIENIVDDAINSKKDIYRSVASYVLDVDYNDISDEDRTIIKKYMIPGADKSNIPGCTRKKFELLIKYKFRYILDCDIESETISDTEIRDGYLEAMHLIFYKYRFEIEKYFNLSHRAKCVEDTLDYIKCFREKVESSTSSVSSVDLHKDWFPISFAKDKLLNADATVKAIMGTKKQVLNELDKIEQYVRNLDNPVYE